MLASRGIRRIERAARDEVGRRIDADLKALDKSLAVFANPGAGPFAFRSPLMNAMQPTAYSSANIMDDYNLRFAMNYS